MRKILPYNKFSNVSEGFPKAYHDPMYGSDIFRVRYRQVNDLSNKKGNDTKPVPTNDLLDGFGVGDVVRGKCVSDGKYYEGKIISIGKDGEGENVTVKIEHEGEMHRLAPSTITFAENGDVGNRRAGSDEPRQDDISITGGPSVIPTTYESKSN